MFLLLFPTLSQSMSTSEAMPSVEKFKEMSADLEFKDKQMEYSQSTLEKLKQGERTRAGSALFAGISISFMWCSL